jgi:hypothetical protein
MLFSRTKTIHFLLIAFVLLLCNLSFGQSYIGYLKKETNLIDRNKTVIEVIKKGEAVFIHSLPLSSEFYLVNHINTNNEGFVSAKNIYHLEEVIEDTAASFSKISLSDKKYPIIRIRNSTHSNLKIKINCINYEIESKNEILIPLEKGTFTYVVTGANMHPHYGKEALEEFKMYDWDFYIE